MRVRRRVGRSMPAPVVDAATGRVVLLTTYDSGAVTEGQIIRGAVTAEQGRRAPLLFSAPSDSSSRAAMAVRVGRDGGARRRAAFGVSGAPAAYSAMVQLGATLGLLYETGDLGPYETIAFRRIPLRELEG